MPFLEKSKKMKKSKLSRRKIAKKATSEADGATENVSDATATTTTESDGADDRRNEVSVENQKLREENQYLKLLLGVSHKVDQLYDIWNGHFPNAFHSANTLTTYLDLHSKQKQSDLILKTFHHVETIKHFLADHKTQMLGPAAQNDTVLSSLNERSNVVGNNNSASSDLQASLRMMTISSAVAAANGSSSSTASVTNGATFTSDLSSESSLTKQQRNDLGRMMSVEV